MKPLKFSARFLRHFRQRISHHEALVAAYQASVEAFRTDRAAVGDHHLAGKMGMLRAFSVTDNYRVIYAEFREYFLFEDIGTHAQVYAR